MVGSIVLSHTCVHNSLIIMYLRKNFCMKEMELINEKKSCLRKKVGSEGRVGESKALG